MKSTLTIAAALSAAILLANTGVYPTPEASKGLFSLAVLPPDVDRLFNRIWTGLKTGQ